MNPQEFLALTSGSVSFLECGRLRRGRASAGPRSRDAARSDAGGDISHPHGVDGASQG